MGDLRSRVRSLIAKFGSRKVAEVCGISELMALRVGAEAPVDACVLVRVSEQIHRLEGENWAAEITATRRKVAADISPLDLSDAELVVRNAIVADASIAAIVPRPGVTARDLLAAGPGVNVVGIVQAAGRWLREHPERAKKNGAAFLGRWVRTEQEKTGRAPLRVVSGGVYGRLGPPQPASPETRQWAPKLAECPTAEESGVTVRQLPMKVV